MVRAGDWGQKVAFSLRMPIKGIIKKTIFKQFCGGESIDECDSKIKRLAEYQIGTILDYSVEGMETDEELDQTRDEIISTILKSKANESIPFAVFKPTGICKIDLLERANAGEDQLNEEDKKEWHLVLQRVDAICSAAFEANVPLFIDAEDSWYQDSVDSMVWDMMVKYNKEKAIIYNTLQMYRHDRLQFLKDCHYRAQETGFVLGIKLVRGAYMEKERERAAEKGYKSPIQDTKEATDTDYDSALLYMIEHVDQISFCAGTHNEYSSTLLTRLMDEYKIDKSDKRVYSAQLLGMSDHISFNLASEGYNVAKYVPYGPVKKVMPYLMRRAQENTSVAGQVGRELGLITKEKKRRKQID